ncbi:MAG: hypothetical protein KDA89_11015, partial [Planctomycetaceae bacterium]|nr:hypothetical protein [Planctomycetaceae bacterium]
MGEILGGPMEAAARSVQEFGADVNASDLLTRESAGTVFKSWIATKVELQKLSVALQAGSSSDTAGSLYIQVQQQLRDVEFANKELAAQLATLNDAKSQADAARRPLDHKKFLDMLVDDVEEKFIELVEGTRAQTSNIDNYLKRLGTALEDDLNAQFYHPAFRRVRETSYFYDVSVGQVETTSVVANNRMFAKVSPQATMEFDLPKRDILINEAMNSALAAYNDYGALMGDPNFLSLMKMYSGQSPSMTFGGLGQSPYIQEVLPGLPSGTD